MAQENPFISTACSLAESVWCAVFCALYPYRNTERRTPNAEHRSTPHQSPAFLRNLALVLPHKGGVVCTTCLPVLMIALLALTVTTTYAQETEESPPVPPETTTTSLEEAAAEAIAKEEKQPENQPSQPEPPSTESLEEAAEKAIAEAARKTEEVLEVSAEKVIKPEYVRAEGFVYDDYIRIIFHPENFDETSVFNSSLISDMLAVSFNRPITIDTNILKISLEEYLQSIGVNADEGSLIFKMRYDDFGIRKFIGEGYFGIDLLFPDDTLLESPPLPIAKPAVPGTDDGQQLTDSGEQAADKSTMGVERERVKNGIRLIFPWEEKAAAAVFTRNNYIWMFFDRPTELKLDAVTGIKYISDIRQVNHFNHTILRITVDPAFHTGQLETMANLLNVKAYKDGVEWLLEIRESAPDAVEAVSVTKPLRVATRLLNDRPIAFISAVDPLSAIEFTDPEIGDTLYIIPLDDSEAGIHPQREYVDFTLFPTRQGIVIRRKSDIIKVSTTVAGILITSDNDDAQLSLSPELFTAIDTAGADALGSTAIPTQRSEIPSDTIFPFDFSQQFGRNTEEEKDESEGDESEEEEDEQKKQKPKKVVDISRVKQELFHQLNNAPEEEKAARRFDIAKFYFSEALYSEALGTLGEIKNLNPLFEDMLEVDLMIAASNYLLDRYWEAETQFSQLLPEMQDHESFEEARLWLWSARFQRNRGDRKKNAETIPLDYIASYDKFMQHYPNHLRYHFGLLVVEELLDNEKVGNANTILEIISYSDIPEEYVNHTKFTRARIAEMNGDNKTAVELWEELAADSEDRYNRARATFALTQHKLVYGQIDVDEAVETFHRLGIVWRGDSFELDLLKLIGQLYVVKGEYRKGLQAWKTLVDNFPSTKESLFIAGRMKKVFIELFDEGEAYNLSPLEALTLYFEFRDLTPVGERGDRIIQQLAQHFINADLLDNASSLLTHQVRFRTNGDRRNQLVLKLADLHISNNRPEKAIEALGFFDKTAVSEEVIAAAKYLEVRALIDMQRYDEAFARLRDDFSKPAQDARLDIFWQQKNWFAIIGIIESRLPSMRGGEESKLTEEQTNDILRLAVAYAAQEYREQLRQLRANFLRRIADEKSHNIFDFVTHDIASIDHARFAETIQLDEIEHFMNEYAFWPGKDWPNAVSVLAPKIAVLVDKETLTEQERNNVIRLAIAYAMQPDDSDSKRALGQLARDFREVIIDRDTLPIFGVLDGKVINKKDDAVFEGKIPLNEISSFIEKYRSAYSISELNAAIQ